MSYGPARKPRRGFSIISSIRRTASTAYTANWEIISESVKTRDGCRCRYCGRVFPRSQLQANHLIPVAAGGRTTMANLATTCLWCHAKRPGHDHMRGILPGHKQTKRYR